MNKYLVEQEYHSYSEEDHATWSALATRHMKFNYQLTSKEYRKGFEKLDLGIDRIIRIDELSHRLKSVSGWTLVPVSGLIPTRDFFYMLINKKYPVTVSIRKPQELDFSEQPDIFHDIFGHVPLLTNEKFYRFLTEFSITALKYVNNEKAVEFLGRLYWYTYEMGVISEDGAIKPYGGAIITSHTEITQVYNPAVPKLSFDIRKVINTPYNPYDLQEQYFLISNFDDLFFCTGTLERTLIDHLTPELSVRTLSNYPLNHFLSRNFKNVIGFLNDVQFSFPNAVSFVAGQPDEKFFNVEEQIEHFGKYVAFEAGKSGQHREKVLGRIGQYGKTKGIINDIIAKYLRTDESLQVTEDDILVTVGAQEAFSIIVATIVNRDEDVILVEDPGYIGMSGFAKIFGYPINAININEEGIDLHSLEEMIIRYMEKGKRVKLVYVIPDFQNPSGACMPIGNRLALLDLSLKYNFLIVEDSVYNSFTYVQKKIPTIKSLDKNKRVVFVGSFSKSLFPGLRIGYIVADQKLVHSDGKVSNLSDEFAKVKAQITNNTSSISQAIVGGILLNLDYSLDELNRNKFDTYKMKRNKMISCLHEEIGKYADDWADGISWNEPEGGFFIRMTLPFFISDNDVLECARDFGVIFCPMHYFYLHCGGQNEIRLTFSNLTLGKIEEGISRLAGFIKGKINEKKKVGMIAEL